MEVLCCNDAQIHSAPTVGTTLQQNSQVEGQRLEDFSSWMTRTGELLLINYGWVRRIHVTIKVIDHRETPRSGYMVDVEQHMMTPKIL